jgi:hypothetical protein
MSHNMFLCVNTFSLKESLAERITKMSSDLQGKC